MYINYCNNCSVQPRETVCYKFSPWKVNSGLVDVSTVKYVEWSVGTQHLQLWNGAGGWWSVSSTGQRKGGGPLERRSRWALHGMNGQSLIRDEPLMVFKTASCFLVLKFKFKFFGGIANKLSLGMLTLLHMAKF
jgi:hypothetical protein